MNFKIILFLVSIIATSPVLSQTPESALCDSQTLVPIENVNAFIKRKKEKSKIVWKFFYNGFELSLSDTTYKIERFTMTWNAWRSQMLVSRPIKGNFVSAEIESKELINDQLQYKKDFSLTTIAPGALITFDSIVASKNGRCFKIPSFVINTVLKKREEK